MSNQISVELRFSNTTIHIYILYVIILYIFIVLLLKLQANLILN